MNTKNMSKKYLDSKGVSYLWQKITDKYVQKQSIPTVENELIYFDTEDGFISNQLLLQDDVLFVNTQEDYNLCTRTEGIEMDVLGSWQQFQCNTNNSSESASNGNGKYNKTISPEYGKGVLGNTTGLDHPASGYGWWYNDGANIKNDINSGDFNGYIIPFSKNRYSFDTLFGCYSSVTTSGDQIGFSIVNDKNALPRRVETTDGIYYRNTLYDKVTTDDNGFKHPSESAWVKEDKINNTAKVIFTTSPTTQGTAESFPTVGNDFVVYDIENIQTSEGRKNPIESTTTVKISSTHEAIGYLGFLTVVVTNSTGMELAQGVGENYTSNNTGTIYVFGSVFDIKTQKWNSTKIIDGSNSASGDYWKLGKNLVKYNAAYNGNEASKTCIIRCNASYDNGKLEILFGDPVAYTSKDTATFNGSKLSFDFTKKSYSFESYHNADGNPINAIKNDISLSNFTPTVNIDTTTSKQLSNDEFWNLFTGDTKFMYNAYSYKYLYIEVLNMLIDNKVIWVHEDGTNTEYGLNENRTEYISKGNIQTKDELIGSRLAYNPITKKLFYSNGEKIYQIAENKDNIEVDLSDYYTKNDVDEIINNIQDQGVEYTSGSNISIDENNKISALGYTYDVQKKSFAEGNATVANGIGSHSEGEKTFASGIASHAEGFETIASGVASHSEGAKYESNRSTESAGQASHAEGASTYAKADGSHTEGILNTAGRFLDEISTAAQELGISGTQEELAAKLLGYGAHAEGMNNEALGSCSHAEGNATKALANSTHAEGDTTLAFGEASHSEGYNTQAKGNQSHAEGSNTAAIGNSSHTEGTSTTASGSFSHAEGSHTEASGRDSHAEGAYNKAIGIASHAEGTSTTASSECSHTEGYSSVTGGTATTNDLTVGTSTTSGAYAHAEGNATMAKGVGSHSEGKKTFASGTASHAEGDHTTALGGYSHTEGYNSVTGGDYTENNLTPGKSTTSGAYAHAEGNATMAIGRGAHSEGQKTLALGVASHAEGTRTEASGIDSHAEGCTTTALGGYSHTEGYNSVTGGDYTENNLTLGTSTTPGSYAHAEGNATMAKGVGSHSEGQKTFASGAASHAEGYATKASGNYSHAEGYATKASGNYSHTEGFATKASGNYSHTEGYCSVTCGDATINNLTPGESTTPGSYAHAEGNATMAIGRGAHSEGQKTLALGIASHAEGANNLVSCDYSHAEGRKNAILGTSSPRCHVEGSGNAVFFSNSHAEGSDNISHGYISHIEGAFNTVTGYGAHAEGFGNIASGDSAHAEGGIAYHVSDYQYTVELDNATYNSSTGVLECVTKTEIPDDKVSSCISADFYYGTGSWDFNTYWIKQVEKISTTNYKLQLHADALSCITNGIKPDLSTVTINKLNLIIRGNIASGNSSHSEGKFTKAQGIASHAEGNATIASGNHSHTEGNATIASGIASHTEGYNSVTGGDYTENNLTEGKSTNSGAYAHAEGNATMAIGRGAHSEGQKTFASGIASHAEGCNTQAKGNQSHAEGNKTTALGGYSHTEGYYTIANNNAEHAEGNFNKSNTTTISSIGIGTGNTDRKNAFEVMQNGDTYIIGVGGYDGTNSENENSVNVKAKSLQEIIDSSTQLKVKLDLKRFHVGYVGEYENEQELYIGFPSGTDVTNFELEVVRWGSVKYRVHIDDTRETVLKYTGEHKIKNISRTPTYISDWTHDKDLFQVKIGEYGYDRDGYSYYRVLGKVISQNTSGYSTEYVGMLEYINTPNSEDNTKFLPIRYKNSDGSFKIPGQFFNKKNNGICVMFNNKTISKMVKFGTIATDNQWRIKI